MKRSLLRPDFLVRVVICLDPMPEYLCQICILSYYIVCEMPAALANVKAFICDKGSQKNNYENLGNNI